MRLTVSIAFNESYLLDGSNSQAQSDVPVPIVVVPLENIRHALQTDAGLHEQVETESLFPSSSIIASASSVLRVRVEQQLYELRTQPVSKRHERVRELLQGDVPASVRVEAIEEPSPC